MAEKVNLHKIVEMHEKEFRKHISNWLRDKDLSRELQAKLRKNLIENFSNTRLGKIINAQHRGQKLFKSPLSLILNTLVAEFLYAENCHYSLSVFCTEMPNEIISSDFENRTDFRFSKENLVEILEAIGDGNFNESMKNLVLEKYMQSNGTGKSRPSFLYVIFETISKNLFQKSKTAFDEYNSKNSYNVRTKFKHKTPKIVKGHMSNKVKQMFTQNFRFLKKYLLLLTEKMKEISIFIYKLRHKSSVVSENKSEIIPELKKIHQNLDKISRLLSKQNNNKLSSLLAATNNISKKIEICIDHFGNILKNKTQLKSETPPIEKDYQEWILEIKNSKSGKEFLSKLESSIKKMLTKQKHRMLHKFVKKLENEKKLLKLRYRQQYFNSASLLEPKSINENLNTQCFSSHLEKSNEFKELSKSAQIDNIVNNDSSNIVNSRSKNEKIEESKPELTRVVDYRKKLQDNIVKKTHQEKCVDSIVHEARMKIQELENESLKIDDAFKAHLLLQRNCNVRSKQDIESIWGKYNLEKTILHKKGKILRKNPKISKFKLETLEKDLTAIMHTATETNVQHQEKTFSISNDEDGYDTTNSIVFENPFKESNHKVSAQWCFSQYTDLKQNNYSVITRKDSQLNQKTETENRFLSETSTVLHEDAINVQEYDVDTKTCSNLYQKLQKEGIHVNKTKQPLIHNKLDPQVPVDGHLNNNHLLIISSQSNSQYSDDLIKNANKESGHLHNIFQMNSLKANENEKN